MKEVCFSEIYESGENEASMKPEVIWHFEKGESSRSSFKRKNKYEFLYYSSNDLFIPLCICKLYVYSFIS